MSTILTPTHKYDVATRDGLWMSADDAERVTGFALKPEGMCRDEICVPMSAESVRGAEIDVEAEVDAETEVTAEGEVEVEADKPKAKPLRMKVSRAKERALMREFGLEETALTEEEAVKRRSELKTLIRPLRPRKIGRS